MIEVKDYIRTVPDYPIKGVNFYDLNSLFASNIWCDVVEELAEQMIAAGDNPTHLVGLESRGFVVGAALSHAMSLPFVMIRKKGAKYPGKLLEETYELEYGEDTLTLQEGILGHTSRVILTDDLIATGGSMLAAKRLVEQTEARVLGGATVIALEYLIPDSFNIPYITMCGVTE
jgi:adenine phosphoribosyltransferase